MQWCSDSRSTPTVSVYLLILNLVLKLSACLNFIDIIMMLRQLPPVPQVLSVRLTFTVAS